jgi:hypothetical protein
MQPGFDEHNDCRWTRELKSRKPYGHGSIAYSDTTMSTWNDSPGSWETFFWNNTHHKQVSCRRSLPVYIHVVWLHRCVQSSQISRTVKKMLWVTTSTKPWCYEISYGFTHRQFAQCHLEQSRRLDASLIPFRRVRPYAQSGLAYSNIIRRRLGVKFGYISTGSIVA